MILERKNESPCLTDVNPIKVRIIPNTEANLMKRGIYITLIIMIVSMLCLTSPTSAVRPSRANYGDNITTHTLDGLCTGPFGTFDEGTDYLKDFRMNGGNVNQKQDNRNVNHFVDVEGQKDPLPNSPATGEAAETDTSPICMFAAGGSGLGAYKGTITVGSQMNVREISSRMSIGSMGISDNTDAPINLRYTFDAAGLATDPKDDLATGAARVYSNVEMQISDDTYDLNYTAPKITGHFQDRQEQSARGLFHLATTFEYTT